MKIEVLLTDKECRRIRRAINQRISHINYLLRDWIVKDTEIKLDYEEEMSGLQELRIKLDNYLKAAYEAEEKELKDY